MKISKGRAWVIAGVIVATTATGFAGYQESRTIGVAAQLTQGWGSLGGLGHDSTNDAFYVGCDIVGVQNQPVTGTCRAKNSAGKQITCAAAAGHTESLRMPSDDSYLVMNDMNLNAACDLVSTTAESFEGPKSVNAAAGSTKPVTISGSVATGAMGTVYNSADSVQNIGCKLKGTATSNTVTCTAKTNSNPPVTFDCSSTGPATHSMAEAVRAIKDDSYLELTRSGSTCTKILVRNDSRYAPRR